MAKEKIEVKAEDREQLMADFNNALTIVVGLHMKKLKPYELYLVLVKLTDDIFRWWRKALKEE